MAQVFISYAKKDRETARDVVKYLENNGISCWLDNRNTPPDTNRSDAIHKAIQDCPAFLIVQSKNASSSNSNELSAELELATQKSEDSQKLILPLTLDDSAVPDKSIFRLPDIHSNRHNTNPDAPLRKLLQDLRRNLPDEVPVPPKTEPTAENCCQIAESEFEKGNYKTAADWYRRAVNLLSQQLPPKKTEPSQISSAEQWYLNGLLCEDNFEHAKAVEWYRQAAEQGHTNAQYNLGSCYYKGHGIAQDIGMSVIWYQKAAARGHVAAQYCLGACYEQGNGVAQNYVTAAELYRKSAEHGFALAQYALGVCYEKGNGVPKDPESAVSYYAKAAARGLAQAQYALGVCYEQGNGVPENRETAVSYYTKAAEQGLKIAKTRLKEPQVFISYSTKEADQANEIREALEIRGIGCWIAPRDMPIGADYMSSIPEGIKKCPYFLPVLSEISQNSSWVRNELGWAIKQHKEIFPLKIEDCAICDRFTFALDNVHICDYYQDKETAIQKIITRIREHPSQDTPDSEVIR